MPLHFQAAPWQTALKLISVMGTLLVAGLGYVAYHAIPAPSGFTHYFGLGIALVLIAIPIFGFLFSVTGYIVDGNDLYIQRPLWRTRLSIDGLSRIWLDPSACTGSMRIIGNGGLFSFTGLYQNPMLGRYRLFATDLTRSVVLVLPRRVVVITPATPQTFVDHLHNLFPLARVGSEGWRT